MWLGRKALSYFLFLLHNLVQQRGYGLQQIPNLAHPTRNPWTSNQLSFSINPFVSRRISKLFDQIRRKFCLQMFLEHWRMKSGDLKCNRLSVRIIWQLLNLHITATLFYIFLKMTPSFTEFHIGVLHWKVYLHQNGFLTPHKKLGRFLEKDKYFFIN